MKTCSKCRLEKAGTEFYKRQSYCKDCSKLLVKEYNKNNKDKVKQYSRTKHLKSKFGLTPDQFDSQLDKQGGLCPLCQRPSSGVGGAKGVVDHCHKTGKVRGILCHPCNSALHALERDITWADRAVEYLSKGGVWPP